MSTTPLIRDAVLRSLSAIGATHEAKFYAELFAAQDAERFALIVIDPRCLKNPLLESLISNLRILADLGLYPVLLVGALHDDRTAVKFQAQRLAKELEAVSIQVAKLNTASYGLIPEVTQKARAGILPILEMTERRGRMNLQTLVADINPNKIIFLQPSGGISRDGIRVPVINIDRLDETLNLPELTAGQAKFMALVKELSQDYKRDEGKSTVYVMASPLNLLVELFTTKGSGTMLRHAASIQKVKNFKKTDTDQLKSSIEGAFDKILNPDFFNSKITAAYIDTEYRGGAIFSDLSGLPYLSKFWVSKAARGEGIAKDIWECMCEDIPTFFWRSRMENPFNEWYMRACDGMQINGDWRVFWKGLDAPQIPSAVIAASSASDDFLTQNL